jgi:hypothetical protein
MLPYLCRAGNLLFFVSRLGHVHGVTLIGRNKATRQRYPNRNGGNRLVTPWQDGGKLVGTPESSQVAAGWQPGGSL